MHKKLINLCTKIFCKIQKTSHIKAEVKGIKSNYLHNVENVVQSTFQNVLITFKHRPYNSYFEFSSKRVLTKNPNLIFFLFFVEGGGA